MVYPAITEALRDVLAEAADADVVVERIYTTPFVNATSMEPRGCVGEWDAAAQRATPWDRWLACQ